MEHLTLEDLPVQPKEIALKNNVPVISEELDSGVSGLLVTRGTRATIFVNESDSERRKRFSTAHELGHFLLRHHSDRGDHVHVDRGITVLHRNSRSSEGVDLAEIEANQFAASLLMPAHLLRMAIEKYASEDRLDESIIEKLADKKLFHVSVQAMTIRLERLGLL